MGGGAGGPRAGPIYIYIYNTYFLQWFNIILIQADMFHFPIFAQRLIDLKSGEADSESLMSHEVRRFSLQSGWSGWSS